MRDWVIPQRVLPGAQDRLDQNRDHMRTSGVRNERIDGMDSPSRRRTDCGRSWSKPSTVVRPHRWMLCCFNRSMKSWTCTHADWRQSTTGCPGIIGDAGRHRRDVAWHHRFFRRPGWTAQSVPYDHFGGDGRRRDAGNYRPRSPAQRFRPCQPTAFGRRTQEHGRHRGGRSSTGSPARKEGAI